MVKGYREKEGLDYLNTYSLVTRLISIQILIVIAYPLGIEVHQVDVKTNFFNGELDKIMYGTILKI